MVAEAELAEGADELGGGVTPTDEELAGSVAGAVAAGGVDPDLLREGDPDEWVEIVAPTEAPLADRQLHAWLARYGLVRSHLASDQLRGETSEAFGRVIRRYLMRRRELP